MADNVEIKIEQLTDAIRSLYSRPALSQSEISNLMTSLAQKFENSSDANIEKFTAVLVNETRKVLEEKHHQMQEQLFSFENLVKQVSQHANNPKLSMEVTKILNEVNSMFTKLSNQEIALQKINQALASSRTQNPVSEIIKLSNDFQAFSRGFENITHTLNKNFTDFLEQVKALGGKQEIAAMQIELETISGNINSVISALAIIDHKYQDLTGLIDAFSRKESVFNDSLNEFKQITNKFDILQDSVLSVSSKEDMKVVNERINHVNDYIKEIRTGVDESLNQNNQKILDLINTIEQRLSKSATVEEFAQFKADLENLTRRLGDKSTLNKEELLTKIHEILGSIKAQGDKEIQEQLFAHTTGVNEGINFISSQVTKLQEGIDAQLNLNSRELEERTKGLYEKLDFINQNIEKLPAQDIKDRLGAIEKSLEEITKQSLSSVIDLIAVHFADFSKSLDNRDDKNKEGYELAISTLREDLKTFMDAFSTLRDEVAQINKGNIRILQEPIERALKDLREVTIGKQLNEIQESVKDTTQGITMSFEHIKESFERIASNSNVEILSQLRDAIPKIADKLEIFRNHVVSENSASLTELKSSFYEVSETIKAYLEDTTYKVQEEIKTSYQDSLSTIKLDLQTLSNHLIESVENVNANISKEFESHKSNIDALLEKISENDEAITLKIANIQNNLEEAGTDSLRKITESLNLNGALVQDVINELKNDLIAGILGNSKNNKTNFAIIEEKLNTVIANQEQKEVENPNNTILDAINSVEEKVERTNLQQIHNAKELMEEIQTINSEILKKFEDNESIALKICSIDEKISELKSTDNEALENSIELLKDHVDESLKNVFNQVSLLLEKDEEEIQVQEQEPQEIPEIENYLKKIDEYLTNVEYLKNNLSEDIRECIEAQIMDLQDKFESALSAKNEEASVEVYNLIQKASNIESSIERINQNISKIVSSTNDTSYTYSLQDVESDVAKLRLSLEKNLKGDNYREFINRLIELKNINLENNKLNHTIQGQITNVNNWLKAASGKLEALSKQVDKAEQLSMEEIKTRLIHSEKSGSGARAEEVAKKQFSYLEDMDEKLNYLIKNKTEEFNPAEFIDVTYENMKQTKNLAERVNNIENKIDKIQGYMEKIIAYIEE